MACSGMPLAPSAPLAGRAGTRGYSARLSGMISQPCADNVEHPDFPGAPEDHLTHPGTRSAPACRDTPSRADMYRFAALRGEIPAPAMIIQPGECPTHPHMTGWVPHPSGHITPDMRTFIRISPLTLAEQLPQTGHIGPGSGRTLPKQL